MTKSDNKRKNPKILIVNKNTYEVKLILHGQGVIVFDADDFCVLTFCNNQNQSLLRASFTENSVIVNMEVNNEPLIDTNNRTGIMKNVSGIYYWFSIDSQNQRLYAGIGEVRLENIIYQYQFPQENREKVKLFLESLKFVNTYRIQIRYLLRDPVTKEIPLLVKNTDDLTMDNIALSKYMPKSNLSTISQKLYDCISGKKFILNTPDFPDFSDAIEYSINTPGMWCYECLQNKATEFDKKNPNYEETYLRITLGENNGESPGIPYVMEIWPIGHYSPIHNHGGSSAIIRVLNGSINVSLFPFLTSSKMEPFVNVNLKKDDITWISPTLNQVHQLKNLETSINTCITIQCYMYEEEDYLHYDYFDYLDTNSKKHKYEPNSDMDFIDFKNLMREEWSKKNNETNICTYTCFF
jgi:hypothetical protein